MAIIAEIEFVHRLNKCTYTNLGKLVTDAVKCQICQQQRLTLSPRHGTIHQGDQPATWGQVGHFLCGKDNILLLLE